MEHSQPSRTSRATPVAGKSGDQADENSLKDSTYGSISNSDEIPRTPVAIDATPNQVEPGFPIPGTNLFKFSRGGDEATLDYYGTIRRGIKDLSAKEVTKKHRDPPGRVVVKLAIIGESSQDARWWVVVLGEPHLEKIVCDFFRTTVISQLLNPDSVNFPGLPFMFIPRPPKRLSVPMDIEVSCSRTLENRNTPTYAGLPILLNESQQCTFGGIIKVVHRPGYPELYGFTAGHAVQNVQLKNDSPAPIGNGLCVDITDMSAEGPHKARNTIGHVLDTSALAGVRAKRVKPSYDWAVFSVCKPLMNKALSATTAFHVPGSPDRVDKGHEVLISERPDFHDGVSDPVLLLAGTDGSQRGELLNLPTDILLDDSEAFAEAYTLQLEHGTVREGDSGAWVVHYAAPQLYGHVVANDLFGDAYVLPAPDVFENIRQCMGAMSVALPSQDDISVNDQRQSVSGDRAAVNTVLESDRVTGSSFGDKSSLTVPLQQELLHDNQVPSSFVDSGCLHCGTFRPKPSWGPEFNENRIWHNEPAVMRLKVLVNDFEVARDDEIQLFLKVDQQSLRSRAEEVIQKFCRHTNENGVNFMPDLHTPKARAWLKDSSIGDKVIRLRSSTELYEHFINQPTKPDPTTNAYRRVIKRPSRTKNSDVSFLFAEPGADANKTTYLSLRNTSVNIVGIDSRKWTVYSFSDDFEEHIDNNEFEDGSSLWRNDSLDDTFSDDDIESGIGSILEPTTDISIWDPRKYWLKICQRSLTQIVAEWSYLTHKLESSMEQHVS
ncbi:hypothetical protein N0V90_010694 [Kalmusia sp. IMI 367209]|nr:hypothetical protein N0V90_010694 [Kalmusia sp. IMI 367209]